MGTYESYWDNICQIYFLTKHYLLLAEELSDDFDTFLQPVKEHRDAFDHIARVYGYKFLNSEIKDIDKYCKQNMKKAVGHAYRAFFDTADWLSYVCRRKIRLAITGKSESEIIEKYPRYAELKATLIEIPKRIASIRENKDVSDNMDELIAEVDSYKEVLDELLMYYDDIQRLFEN